MRKIKKVLLVHSSPAKEAVAVHEFEKVELALEKVRSVLKNNNVIFEEFVLSRQEFHPDRCLTVSREGKTDSDIDLIISVGGDGTFLSTARHFLLHGLPIIGVNAGHLGFLMEISPDEMENALQKLLRGQFHLSERMVLEARVYRDGEEQSCFHAFNDAVISRGAVSRMVELTLSVEEEMMSHYRADGTIISTPSGSTAYNLSAGGPILTPDLDAFVITPISPHTLGVRPVVVKANKILELEVLTGIDNTILTIDGQEGMSLIKGDKIRIFSSPYKVKLYRLNKTGFVAILREKLGWHS